MKENIERDLQPFIFSRMESPIGPLLLVGKAQQGIDILSQIVLPKEGIAADPQPEWVHHPGCYAEAARQLDEYFAAGRRVFDLPLAPAGTAFQHKVWAVLQQIGYGRVQTYGNIAMRLGKPRSARAIGQANGANPIPIIIPCHRVIAASRQLGGYSGGLEIKRRLLAVEGIKVNENGILPLGKADYGLNHKIRI